ncbi:MULTISPECIES: hypothetical protein [Vibrio]|uniref:hypothetical protein n=1 Tax=Vibrio TaxID=662 RepID=UPI00080E4DBD|nr:MULTISPECIES: hypothetical protein [Vibrio]OCH40536.1 hypothetical protein A6E07_10175 [Vibrio cyclitrophicus]PMM04638.1 hypothetical protein BCT62_21095 [Vibrio splendidus]
MENWIDEGVMYNPKDALGLRTDVDTNEISTEELIQNIDALTKELERRREVERDQVLSDIKEKVSQYRKLQPTINDFDLAKKIGLNVSGSDTSKETPVEEKKKKKQPPHFYYKDSSSVEHITGSASPRTLAKSPWKELIEDGTINNHTVKYEKNINGEMKYWTKLNENERPDDAIPVNRNGVDLDKIRVSINSIA